MRVNSLIMNKESKQRARILEFQKDGRVKIEIKPGLEQTIPGVLFYEQWQRIPIDELRAHSRKLQIYSKHCFELRRKILALEIELHEIVSRAAGSATVKFPNGYEYREFLDTNRTLKEEIYNLKRELLDTMSKMQEESLA